MCGIYACFGKNITYNILDKLEALEYRGYDSCGIAYEYNNKIYLTRTIGNVSKIRPHVDKRMTNISIGHTRWATHGDISVTNAHPHTSNKKRFYIVHNGVIYNYLSLKNKYQFNYISNTDSEAIVCLLDYYSNKYSTTKSIEKIMNELEGSYAVVIIDSQDLNKLYFMKKESPLLLTANKEISSDQLPFNKNTTITILNDYDYGYVSSNDIKIFNIKGNNIRNTFIKSENPPNIIKKNNYMYEEIVYQVAMLPNISAKYIDIDKKQFLYEINKYDDIFIIGSGSSYYAASILAIEYSKKLNKRVFNIISSNIKNYNIIRPTLAILISQSGETKDTNDALIYLKQKNITIISLCNNIHSTLGYKSDIIYPLLAKREISVASTKAFLATIYIGRGLLNNNYFLTYNKESNNIKTIIQNFNDSLLTPIIQSNLIFFLGMEKDYYICEEAALKLREITYKYAFAQVSAELKHGTLSLIDKSVLCIGIVTNEEYINTIQSNINEVKSRGGIGIIISNCYKSADIFITGSDLSLIVYLQLLAYKTALKLNRNIDQPRNLAKSVTVI